ncbi:MAG: 8-oxo-dGTP diphosphatase [Eubacteriales bacterium]|nr:8-oxo-dGTP diphosphatase [Eubacteriales bacterium]
MRNTTLCYIESAGKYLMLHRVKKENDENKDKWIGVGGKFESGETPEECAVREIREETGILFSRDKLRFRGIVTFVSDEWGTEYMFLFTAKLSEAQNGISEADIPEENDEGKLEWVPLEAAPELPVWEGDKIFLRMLSENAPFFSLKLQYSGEKLVDFSVLAW